MRKDYLYWIWLSLRFGQAADGFIEVLEAFGDPYNAYIADGRDLSSRFSADSPLVDRLRDKDITEARRIYDFCVSRGVSILTYGDIEYPARLKTIQHPPILLYYIGTLPSFNRKLCLAVVGTRRMSEYGKRMAYKISYELSAAGAVIVSGMALGCDAVAAAGAIGAHGSTVAVLGSGIDVIYPRQHEKLMSFICQNGAVITEYPPGTPPNGCNFPVRNRIISGLSQGVLAVEGDAKSGALLTVDHAMKQDRRVFAVPGNVGVSNSEGTNALIRNGATVALDGGDILDAFRVSTQGQIDVSGLTAAKACSQVDEALLDRLGLMARLPDAEAPKRTRTAAHPAPPPDPAPETVRYVNRSRAQATDRKEPRKAAPEARPVQVEQKTDAPMQPLRSRQATDQAPPAPTERTDSAAPKAGDRSAEILATLGGNAEKVFHEMPIDCAVSIERLSGTGLRINEIMATLTILEIQGLITSLPGGLYLRK